MLAISCLETVLNLDKEERNRLGKRFLQLENFTDLEFLE